MRTFKFKVDKYAKQKDYLLNVLGLATKLSTNDLETAINKGAVWLQVKGMGKIERVYSSQAQVFPNDLITLYYDSKILSYPALSEAECLFENDHYGIWFKEAGVMPQGTQTGDHTSLLRYIELKKKKTIYLIHRLDRETAGPMIFGYTKEAAHKLGELFQKNLIKKTYEAIILGPLPIGKKQTIDQSIDGKKAITHFEVMDNSEDFSLLKVDIETGRLHQIRRHLDFIGHPVMGDPKYGKGNKNREGLRLLAKSLSFNDPWTKKNVEVIVPQSLKIIRKS